MTAEIDPERILASSATVDRQHARTTLRAPLEKNYGQRLGAGLLTRGHARKQSDLTGDVSLGDAPPSCDTGRDDSLGLARRIQSSSARRPFEASAASPIR